MKIFSRGTETKPTGPAAATAEGPAAEAAAPAEAPPAPPQPDLTAIIDANVKEMSEKIARLASSIETDQHDRADFEAKLEKMEERMRKLSSLTEMISAQYNPFVGAAPEQREPMPAPEVGLAMPPSALPIPPPPAPGGAPSEAPPAASAPMAIALEDPFATIAPSLADAPLPEPEDAHALAPPPAPAEAPAWSPPAEEAAHAHPAAQAPEPAAESSGSPARLWAAPQGFASSMLMLGWADMLLKSLPTRESLHDLLNYYHNIGWLGDPARDQLLAYAEGLAHPEGERAGDWRANVEVHEKSLLFIEKLRALADGRRVD